MTRIKTKRHRRGGIVAAEGGTVVAPKALIPNIGYLLSFKDTEGNIFAILEAVPGNPSAG